MNNLVQLLLEKGADPNVQTTKLTNSHTPMHKAILNNHENILNLFIDFKGASPRTNKKKQKNKKHFNLLNIFFYFYSRIQRNKQKSRRTRF